MPVNNKVIRLNNSRHTITLSSSSNSNSSSTNNNSHTRNNPLRLSRLITAGPLMPSPLPSPPPGAISNGAMILGMLPLQVSLRVLLEDTVKVKLNRPTPPKLNKRSTTLSTLLSCMLSRHMLKLSKPDTPVLVSEVRRMTLLLSRARRPRLDGKNLLTVSWLHFLGVSIWIGSILTRDLICSLTSPSSCQVAPEAS